MKNNIPVSACQEIIVRLLPAGQPTIDRTARQLGIPMRTLQRRLREHGQSYSQLVDAVRCEQARRRLDEPGTCVNDVAKELGYKDSSSFSRAFRRWTGMSPRDYQRHC